MRGARALGLALLWAHALAGCGGEGGAARRFMSLGTAGTGGVYYPIGGALASRLSLRDEGRTYTAEVTGGSVENIQRVGRGEMDLAFAIGTTVYEAFHGGPDFPSPQTRLRVVAPLYANLTHVLARRDPRIETIADFRGRRVSVGAAGSGTEQVARHVLEAYGLSYDEVDERYLSFTESAAALGDGAIDGAIISVGTPASAVLEATTSGRVRLLPIEEPRARQLVEQHSYYASGEVPGGVYPGHDRATPTVSVMNWIVARDDLDPAVVAHVLDILADDLESLRQAVDIAGQIRIDDLDRAPIPLHPAVAAWRERRSGGG